MTRALPVYEIFAIAGGLIGWNVGGLVGLVAGWFVALLLAMALVAAMDR